LPTLEEMLFTGQLQNSTLKEVGSETLSAVSPMSIATLTIKTSVSMSDALKTKFSNII
jgi:hypothetical protein